METRKHRHHEQTQSRMSYARNIVEPEEDEEEEAEERPLEGEETFEALTVDEGLLITGSSESFKRLEQRYGNQKDNYRELVERLMKRTGILCRERMDRDQRKFLK